MTNDSTDDLILRVYQQTVLEHRQRSRALFRLALAFPTVKRLDDRVWVRYTTHIYIIIELRTSRTGIAIRVLYSSVSVGVVHVLCACAQVQSTA